MTLIAFEGFDFFDGESAGLAWIPASLTTYSPGRFGDGRYAATGDGGTYYYIPVSESTVIVGLAWKTTKEFVKLSFRNEGYPEFTVAHYNNGSIKVYRGDEPSHGGSVLLDASNNALYTLSTWNYIEAKATISTTAGAYAVRVNGVAVPGLPDATGVNTSYWSTTSCNNFHIRGGGAFTGADIDDMYVATTSGSVNNNFLGDVRVETLRPTGAGSSTVWTRGGTDSGTNWGQVDEATYNDATDYVTASGVGDKDMYSMSDLATPTGTIYGVQCNIRAKKTDSGTRGVVGVFKVGASEADTTTFGTIATSYQNFHEIRENKPGGTGWTISDVNGMEMGIKVST